MLSSLLLLFGLNKTGVLCVLLFTYYVVSPQAESGPIVTTDSCLHVDPLGRSHRRRRRSQSISIHQPPDDDASIDPWHDSTLTCQSDQHRVTLGWDPFKVFQDAVHMTSTVSAVSLVLAFFG